MTTKTDTAMLLMKAGAAVGLIIIIVTASFLGRQAIPLSGDVQVRQAPRVAIDAGHGGYDGGAQWGGVIEKDINLAITMHVREILLATGHQVTLTRSGDYSLLEQEEASNPKKREDMERRLAVIEAYQPDVILVIHCNAINSPIWSGAQTFYQEGYDRGKLLAEDIQLYLCEFTDTTRKASSLDMFLLREGSMVGSLVEAGFLSNPRERELLQQTGHQRRLATATWLGLDRYLRDSIAERE